MIAPASIYPHVGRCAYCLRDRDDLFWHAQDETYYCADVFRCEARVYLIASRARELEAVSPTRRAETSDAS